MHTTEDQAIVILWESSDYTNMRPFIAYTTSYGYPKDITTLIENMAYPPSYIPDTPLKIAVDCVDLTQKFVSSNDSYKFVSHSSHAAAAQGPKFVDIGICRRMHTLSEEPVACI